MRSAEGGKERPIWGLAPRPRRPPPPPAPASHRQPMSRSWLAVSPLVNQRSLVGLLKAIETTKMTSPQSIAVVLDCAKYIMRVGAQTSFPSEVKSLTNSFDNALSSTYASLRKSGVELPIFLKMYAEPLELVLNVGQAKAVAAQTADMGSMSDSIVALCKSGVTGKKLFQPFLVHVGEARLEKLLEESVAALGVANITSAWVAETRKVILAEAEKLGCEDRITHCGIAHRNMPELRGQASPPWRLAMLVWA